MFELLHQVAGWLTSQPMRIAPVGVQVNVTIASLFITAGLYAQASRIFKTKSASDFTLVLILALIYNEVSWSIYGGWIISWPLIIVTVFNIPALIMIAVGYAKYGRPKRGGG